MDVTPATSDPRPANQSPSEVHVRGRDLDATGLSGESARREAGCVVEPAVAVSLRSWMAAVSDVARAVNDAEPLEQVLELVAEQACGLIGFDYAAVMLGDTDSDRLRVAGAHGLTEDYLAALRGGGSLVIHPASTDTDSPAARAFREGRTIVVPDVRRAGSYGRLEGLAPAQGYRALLAAPLRGTAEALDTAAVSGVIVGYSRSERPFAAPERELIGLLAEQAGLALQTARLRTAQQRVIAELSRANDELRRGRQVLDWAEQQHRALMQLVLDDVGLAGLVHSLAESLDASVTVEDVEGRVLAHAPEEDYCPPPGGAARRRRPAREVLDALTERYEVVRVPDALLRRPDAAAAAHPAETHPSWVAPVVLNGQLVGRLWVTRPRVAPAPVARRVIERFALVVGIEMLKHRHLVDVETRLSGDLLADLLRPGGPTHHRSVLDRATALGHDLNEPHQLGLLALEPSEDIARLPELMRALDDGEARPLTGLYEDTLVVLAAVQHDPGRVFRRAHALADRSSVGSATLIVGPVAAVLEEHSAGYRVARGALRLRRTRCAGGVVDVQDLGLAGLLLETGTPDTLQSFAQRLLRPIEMHDAQRGGDLMPTLTAWLGEGCSTPAAARSLMVHPNTVGYRLSRIERLIGRSVRNADAQLNLKLALIVRDVLRGAGEHTPS